MLEAELIEAFEPHFRDFLNNVGGTLKAFRREPVRPGPDLLIDAVIRGKPITLVAEAKAQGEPRYIRQAADQLRDFMGRFPGAYPIVIAPYISGTTAQSLPTTHIAYFDLPANTLNDPWPPSLRLAR